MRGFFVFLAFCATAYTWLGCLAQWFAGPEAVLTSPENIASRTFATACTLCCLWSLFKILPAAIAAWIAAAVYLAVSWKLSADWVFKDAVEKFTLWTPIFLTTAECFRRSGPKKYREIRK
jgi:hypothetical protein